MARDFTALPYEYLEEMDCLSDAEYGRLVRALQAYSINGEEIQLNGREKDHWKRVRNREDRYKASYADRAASGSKGGKATQANSSKVKQTQARSSAKAKSESKTEYKDNSPNGEIKGPLAAALDEFAKARKAMKKPLTDKARELTIQELEKLAPGNEAMQVAIINQSIQRGWQGVFPLKEDEKKPKTGPFAPMAPSVRVEDNADRTLQRILKKAEGKG